MSDDIRDDPDLVMAAFFGTHSVSKAERRRFKVTPLTRAKWRERRSQANTDLAAGATVAGATPLAITGYNKYVEPRIKAAPRIDVPETTKAGLGLRQLALPRKALELGGLANGRVGAIARHPGTVGGLALGVGVPLTIANHLENKKDERRIKRLEVRYPKRRRRERLAKAKEETRSAAAMGAATAGGALAGHGAYLGAGYGSQKLYIEPRFRAAKTGQPQKLLGITYSPGKEGTEYAKFPRKGGAKSAWFHHGEKFKGRSKSKEFFRQWPKEVPGHRARRIMARTHAGKTGLAVDAAAMAAGAGGAYGLASRKVSKVRVKGLHFVLVPKEGWGPQLLKAPGWNVPTATVGGAGAAGAATQLVPARRKARKKP